MNAPKWAWPLIWGAVGISATVGAYQGAEAIGFKLDRPAWHSELLEYTGYSLCDARENKRAALNRMDALIQSLRAKNVPRRDYLFLVRQRNAIADQLRDIEALLQRRPCR